MPLQYPTGTPAELGSRSARTAERSGRLATASSACPTRTGWQNCKARQRRLPGKKIASCGMCTETRSPAARAFGAAACWTTAWQRRCLDGPFGAHWCAPGGGCSGARGLTLVRPLRQNGPCTRRCEVVLCSAAAVGLCRATTSDGVRRGGAPRWPRQPPAPAGAKRAGRSIGRSLGGEWAASGGWGGWGWGAHLDGGDLRYQCKQARIVPRAALVVVLAVAVGKHVCVLILLAALEQVVAGVPVGMADQVPPVPLPVGAVLGVFLWPFGPREHAEPAGVAVPVLPSVGRARTNARTRTPPYVAGLAGD